VVVLVVWCWFFFVGLVGLLLVVWLVVAIVLMVFAGCGCGWLFVLVGAIVGCVALVGCWWLVYWLLYL
jgi:hypothetical protein